MAYLGKRYELRISVLLTTFNDSAYLSSAIKSILGQSYTEFEFIIVDDGSTDDTEKIVKSFSDERIVLVKIEHRGRGEALNFGLSLCKNDWVAIIDSDDVSHPDRLKKQIEYLSMHEEVNVLSTWYAVFENWKIVYITKTPTEHFLIRKKLLLYSDLVFSGVMFNKNILDQTKFKNHPFQDYELWLELRDTANYHNLPEVLTFYRLRKDSLSRDNIISKYQLMYNVQEKYYSNDQIYTFVLSREEEFYYKGFREYFCGDKEIARKYWTEMGLKIMKHLKIIVAFVITFFPQKHFIIFKEARIRLRLKYYFTWFSSRNFALRNSLDNLLSEYYE